MKFCEKCGNLMIAKKVKNKIGWVCRKCGYVSREKVSSTKILEKVKDEGGAIPVLEEKDTFSTYPKTKILCPECENNEAYWFMQQTRAGDEPPTRFYCCTKCSHKWREY
jgi:DNA-directed RNA polymerase subunit M